MYPAGGTTQVLSYIILFENSLDHSDDSNHSDGNHQHLQNCQCRQDYQEFPDHKVVEDTMELITKTLYYRPSRSTALLAKVGT